VLLQLADPHSDLRRQWDEEHDRHVVQRLLDQIEHDFTPPTWQAFRRVVLDGVSPAVAAAELGLTENVVMLARLRVVKRLREEGRDLLD